MVAAAVVVVVVEVVEVVVVVSSVGEAAAASVVHLNECSKHIIFHRTGQENIYQSEPPVSFSCYKNVFT